MKISRTLVAIFTVAIFHSSWPIIGEARGLLDDYLRLLKLAKPEIILTQ